MADMTITITVTGRVGTNTNSWSRTATVTDLLGAIHRNGESSGNIASSEADTGDGIYSTGAAVMCILHTGENAMMSAQSLDGSRNSLSAPLMPTGVPHIVYNGAGAGGFNGGAQWSGTNTDTPTVDVAAVNVSSFLGLAQHATLTGLKLIS